VNEFRVDQVTQEPIYRINFTVVGTFLHTATVFLLSLFGLVCIYLQIYFLSWFRFYFVSSKVLVKFYWIVVNRRHVRNGSFVIFRVFFENKKFRADNIRETTRHEFLSAAQKRDSPGMPPTSISSFDEFDWVDLQNFWRLQVSACNPARVARFFLLQRTKTEKFTQ
jgi:hypothetical protein